MPGMGTDPGLTSPAVVAAFTAALRWRGMAAALVFCLLTLAWLAARRLLAPAGTGASGAATSRVAEAPARRLLRIGFAVLWIAGGLLQAQPAMPLGLPARVIRPAAAGSPVWVRQLAGWGARAWSFHPVDAAAAAVWIQLGIGIWLLTAARGRWSRLGGLAGAGWGLAVWAFGEAFGGLLAPGATWMFGAPGAALLYALAGAAVALPDRAWEGPRLGRGILAGIGMFFAGMAVLQAWPGRGYWHGMAGDHPGPLAAMVRGMAQVPQPRFLASWVSDFATIAAAHGFAVNLTVVAALGLTGTAMLTTRASLVRPAVAVAVALCLADWVLVQDLGIFGGLGTDPNSMIPMTLALAAGYLALADHPVPAAARQAAAPAGPAGGQGSWRSGWRRRARRLGPAMRAAGPGSVAAVGGFGLMLLGVIPFAAASASAAADPVIAQAINGPSSPLDYRAPAFRLTDQGGRQVSLASLRGKVILLTFLDPVCTDQCPLIAQEFRAASQLLGPAASRVELVAIVANPIYRQLAYTRAFDRQEHLGTLPNWLYLTGSLPQLRHVWQDYGIGVQVVPGGQMIGHSELVFVIGKHGVLHQELGFDPGPGTASTQSSFAGELASAARRELRS